MKPRLKVTLLSQTSRTLYMQLEKRKIHPLCCIWLPSEMDTDSILIAELIGCVDTASIQITFALSRHTLIFIHLTFITVPFQPLSIISTFQTFSTSFPLLSNVTQTSMMFINRQ